MAERVQGYKAFISYAQAPDGPLAEALQRALHQVAKPWYRLRSMRVFRDQTSLSANSALWPTLERALSGSQWLIVLCNPQAANSYWVQKELAWWLEHRSTETLLLVQTGGEMLWPKAAPDFDWTASTALSHLLKHRFTHEPKHVDLRWAVAESDLVMRNGRFRSAVLDLAATLLDRPKDELDGEDVRLHQRTRRMTAAAVTGLVVLSVVATIGAAVAVHQRDLAIARQLIADAELAETRNADASAWWALESVKTRATPRAEGFVRLALSKRERLQQVLEGHSAPIYWLEMDRAGQRAATGGQDGTARLWDLAGNKPIAALAGHRAPIERLSFSPDGSRLVTDAGDGEVRLWQADNGALVAVLPVNPGTPLPGISEDGSVLGRLGSLAWPTFSPNGRSLLIRRTRSLALYDAVTGQALGDIPTGAFHRASFTPDSQRLIVISAADPIAKVWRVADRTALPDLGEHKSAFQSARFDATGQRMLTMAERDEAVLLRDARDGRVIARFGDATLPTSLAEFSGDGNLVATASAKSNQVRVWKAASGELVREFNVGVSPRRLTLSPDGSLLMSISAGAASVWLMNGSAEPLAECSLGSAGDWDGQFSPEPGSRALVFTSVEAHKTVWCNRADRRRMEFEDHRLVDRPSLPIGAAVMGTLLSPDGAVFVTHPRPGVVSLHRTKDGETFGFLYGHGGPITGLLFSRDSQRIVTVSKDQTLRTWSASPVQPAVGISNVLAADTKGRLALHSLDDQSLALTDIATGKRLWTLEGGATQIEADDYGWGRAAIDSQAQTVAAKLKSNDKLPQAGIVIWDASTGRRRAEISHEAVQGADRLRLNGDGSRLLTLHEDGRVARLWNTANGHLTATLTEEGETLNGPSFSDDGRMLVGTLQASESKRRTAKVWAAADGTVLMSLKVPGASIDRARLSPTGRWVATSESDPAVARIWQLGRSTSLYALDNHGKEVGPINFSQDERLVAVGTGDGYVRTWRLSSGALDAELRVPDMRLDAFEFSHDGSLILTSTLDGVRLWHRAERRLITRLASGRGQARFIDEDRLILVSSPRDPPLLYDVATGWQLLLGDPTRSDGGQAKLSPDGKSVVVRTRDEVLSWACNACGPIDQVAAKLASRLPAAARPLTP